MIIRCLILIFLTPAALPSDSADHCWSFIITGDSRGADNGVNSVILAELADEIVNSGVDIFLFSGDLITGAVDDPAAQLYNWLTIMQPVYNAGIPVYVVRGNHEDGYWFPDVSVWHDVFSGDYALPANGPPGEVNLTYSFTHKNALIVGLDQYVDLYALNQPWLDAQLAANTRPHLFVFGHLPAYRAIPRPCLDYYPQQRDAFWQSLARAGARVYFAGHDHFYDHARIDDGDGNPNNDLHQYIIGTAGAPFYTWQPPYEGDNGPMTPIQIAHAESYGYVHVDVDALDVTLTWTARHTNDLSVKGTYSPAESWIYSVRPLMLLAPNGGERLVADRHNVIRWRRHTSAQTQFIRIEYHEGSAWRPINTAPIDVDAGAHTWHTAHLPDSDRYLIRISDWNDPDTGDATGAHFTIFHCGVPLPADLNGDCYVDLNDLAILAADWLRCGNPFDPACAE